MATLRSVSLPRPVSIRSCPRGQFHDHIMKRVLSVLFFLLYFEIGVALLLIPWSWIWTKNYFVNHFPLIAMVARNYFVRGAVSGIGLADMWLAAYELWHRWRHAPN
jgi:hypothetical protein